MAEELDGFEGYFETRHEQPKIWIKQLYLFASKICYNIQKGVKTLEEKMLALMEKLYIEFKSLDGKVGSLDAKVGNLQKDVLRIENKLDTDSKALFDGYSQTYEKLGVIETKVDAISSKVEKQDVEIRVIKGAK